MNHTHLDVPLAQLRLSPTNARQQPGSVDSLANSIARVGLITPLAVTAMSGEPDVAYRNGNLTWSGRGKRPLWVVKAIASGRTLSEFACGSGYLVEAGGRRLAALQLLRDQGKLPADSPVPVMLFESPDLARSVAENTEREAMDPLQQAQAFGRLLGEGRHVEDIATTFGVTVQYVRQRAKLAELVPEVIEAWRQKRLDLQQCAALTFGSPEQQRAIVADPGNIPGALQLRERLRGALVRQEDRRVKFVGLQAYKDAGGRLAEDLFASTADLVDAELLDRLVAQKLAEECESAMAVGGWAFAVAQDSMTGYTHPEYEYPEPDASAQEKVAALHKKAAAIEEQIGEAEGDDDTACHAALSAQLEAVYEEIEAIEESDRRPVAPIGVLLSVAYNGNLQVQEAMRVEDVKDWRAQQRREGSAPPDGHRTPPNPPGREDLTVKCAEEIAQTRQAALALKVAAMPQLALAVLAQWLDFAIFGSLSMPDYPMGWNRPAPLPGHFSRCNTPRPEDLSGQLRAVTLPQAQQRRKPFAAERSRDEQAKACIPLEWYLEQPKVELLQILADAVAHALTDPDSNEKGGHDSVSSSARPTIRALVTAAELDLADYWKPSPAWLKGYGKTKTLQALEGVDQAFAGALAKAKAGEIYEKAAERLAEARWVPEFGRAA